MNERTHVSAGSERHNTDSGCVTTFLGGNVTNQRWPPQIISKSFENLYSMYNVQRCRKIGGPRTERRYGCVTSRRDRTHSSPTGHRQCPHPVVCRPRSAGCGRGASITAEKSEKAIQNANRHVEGCFHEDVMKSGFKPPLRSRLHHSIAADTNTRYDCLQ